MLLANPVLSAPRLPEVLPQLPDAVSAIFADHDLPSFQAVGGESNAAEHIVFGFFYPPTLPPQDFHEACRRRIHNHRLNGISPCQFGQSASVFLVGHLVLFPPGVEVKFLHPVPCAATFPPQSHRGGIHRTIVAGNVPLFAVFRGFPQHILREKVVDPSFRLHPLPQHIPLVKHPRVEPPVTLPDTLRQGGVIFHGEFQSEAVSFFRFQDPCFVEPMLRPFRVAVEPQPAPGDAAPGAGLLHKTAGHQRRLIQQHPGEGDALNEGCRAFVPASEGVEAVFMAPHGHDDQVFRPFFPAPRPQCGKSRQNFRQNIAPQRGNGFPADAKLLPIEAAHSP